MMIFKMITLRWWHKGCGVKQGDSRRHVLLDGGGGESGQVVNDGDDGDDGDTDGDGEGDGYNDEEGNDDVATVTMVVMLTCKHVG